MVRRSPRHSRTRLHSASSSSATSARSTATCAVASIAALAPDPVIGIDGVESRIDAERMRSLLAQALADLPPGEADVLLLLVWAELDQAEIADALSIPVGTVKSRLARARGRVQAGLGRLTAPADPPATSSTTSGGQ